jgi:oligopeptide transport system ATP-binding protein
MTIGKQLAEPLLEHMDMTGEQARKRSIELLELVGISYPGERLKDYPHQYSGGMRQRVMIAMALSCMPEILIADEPTTALDVTIQAQIVELVKRLRQEFGMAIIWITHDLGVVASIAQRVAVMYGGYIIEEAPVKELYANPSHPYTLGLLGSLPKLNETGHTRLYSIEGMPPVLYQKPQSCPFSPRCAWVTERCLKENPPLEMMNNGHRLACWVDTKLEVHANE